ncbi:hypothetical protein J4558_13915 [Leptolyngbya sp. 15MV]|nr:hypothetical protein J4558_13915 [Leptolyngbya sp. 15MV]
MIEIEVQNETHQSQERLRFASVPRIGEGLRLREPDGCWASYDVLDVWYQKAEFGDVWVPYLHVCMTPGDVSAPPPPAIPAGDPLRQPLMAVASTPPQTGLAPCRT